mmetsp:Transcript_118081/g.252286  ORF Transcript_118081/g.252286 Transcript_118081/m.252286 type:complete len:445 (-) Transcript_118081:80-1414(-)
MAAHGGMNDTCACCGGEVGRMPPQHSQEEMSLTIVHGQEERIEACSLPENLAADLDPRIKDGAHEILADGETGGAQLGDHGALDLDPSVQSSGSGSPTKENRPSLARYKTVELGPKRCRLIVRPRSIVIFVIVSIWGVLGMVMLTQLEDLDAVSALYVIVQILTTVGYGDVMLFNKGRQPQAMMVFLSLFALTTVLIIAGLISNVVEWMLNRSLKDMLNRLDIMHQSVFSFSDSRFAKLPKFCRRWRSYEDSWPVIWFATMLLLGTLYYGVIDTCTCSYGRSLVPGCVPEDCEATGGMTRTALEAFYMCSITFTTVGFGDVSPQSYRGRIIALVWMMMGVTATAVLASWCSAHFVEMAYHRRRELDEQSLAKYFRQIDADGNGYLSRYEFCMFALLEYGIVTPEVLQDISKQFDILDESKDGQVSNEEIHRRFTHVRSNWRVSL